jgi:hypothetical protein
MGLIHFSANPTEAARRPAKSAVSLTQRLNPQNLIVLWSNLLKGKKPGPYSVRASSR